MTKECLNCGADMTDNLRMPKGSKFCSRKCTDEHKQKMQQDKNEFFKS